MAKKDKIVTIYVFMPGRPGSPFSRAIATATNDDECHGTNSHVI